MAARFRVGLQIADELQKSHAYGGRSVFGLELPPLAAVLVEPLKTSRN
jgi:hypothetical protein